VTSARPPAMPPDVGFHISPRRGRWLNDPNGPIFWNGQVHLFHQPNWCHAVSDDLVRWTVLGNVLEPTPGGPDRGGAWSGSTVADGNRVWAIYTGADETATEQVVCLASSTDGLRDWVKDPSPVIAAPPANMPVLGFRDPYVIAHDGEWLCVVGAGVPGCGRALLYASHDLRTWRYEAILHERASTPSDAIFTGEMWECPFFLPVDDRFVLGISAWHENTPHQAAAFVGAFDGHRFHEESLDLLDHGPDYYAPTATVDPDGRCLVWGWAWEAHEREDSPYNRGGLLTVPRELSLADNSFHLTPARELESLRTARIGQTVRSSAAGDVISMVADAGHAFDLELVLRSVAGSRFELDLLASPDSRERTTLFVDLASGETGLDTRSSALHATATGGLYSALLDTRTLEVEIRVLVDGSIIEAFVNGRAWTARVHPTLSDATGIVIRGLQGSADINATAWAMATDAITFAD
jgi:beta-fructofuranosidase